MNRKKQLINEIADLIASRILNEEMTAEMNAVKHVKQSLRALPGMIKKVQDEQIDTLIELADSMTSPDPEIEVTYDNYESIAQEMANTANGFLSLPILNYMPEDPDQEVPIQQVPNTNPYAYSYASWEERKRFGDEMQQLYYEGMKGILENLMKNPYVESELVLDLRALTGQMQVAYSRFLRTKL